MEPSQPSQDPILSVTEFNNLVNDTLADLRVWVQGEISGYRVSQNKWITFDLKDEGSKVNCFMTVYQLDQVLEDGMEVKVFGNPRIYVPYGKYSFTIQRVEPVGEGALRRAFELTKQKLKEEGLFSDEFKKPIPRFPESIGVVTSESAAAWTDFQKILENRWSGVEVTLRPSVVQGVNAPGEIVAAIEWFNKFYPVDVLVLTRGGGSLEDLQAFNSEQVCRAVFASKIPIICGVGHERDITLAELSADVRASTPSNAAELVVPDKEEILWKLEAHEKSMGEIVKGEIQRLLFKLKDYVSRFEHVMNDKLLAFTELSHALHFAFEKYQGQIKNYLQKLTHHKERLNYLFANSLQREYSGVQEIAKLLQSFNPAAVLKRGYAIPRQASGVIIRSVQQVKIGQLVQTQLHDGLFKSKVTKKGGEEQSKLL